MKLAIPLLLPLAYALVGVAVGQGVWRADGDLAWLLLLALVWGMPSTLQNRWGVFAAFLAYYLSGAYDGIQATQRFYPDWHIAQIYLTWALPALLLATPFALLWRREMTTTQRGVRLSLALIAVSLPPLGLIGWLSPLLLAGEFFPGFGHAGYALALLLFALISCSVESRPARIGAVALFVAGLTWAVTFTLHAMQPEPPEGWFAQRTSFPLQGNMLSRQIELTRMVSEAAEQGAKVILLPENVAGDWRPTIESLWRPVLKRAEQTGVTVLIGASLTTPEGAQSVVIAGGADRYAKVARMLMPLSMWRPLIGNSYEINLTNPGVAKVQDKRAAFSFCYEELLIWPAMVSMANNPDVLLSVANNWFSSDLPVARIQARSIDLQARLYRIPLLRAVNEGDLSRERPLPPV